MTRGFCSAVLLVLTVACSFRSPAVGGATTAVGGTIAGHVTATGEAAPLSGRRVTAIDVATGARYEASTTEIGGYTMQVPKGTYRLDVELRAGEVLARRPAQTEVNASDVDAQRDFEITVLKP